MRELGLPDVVVNTWYGVLAPVGTPADIVRSVNADINAEQRHSGCHGTPGPDSCWRRRQAHG